MLVRFAILNVKLFDFLQLSAWRMELSDKGERLCGVHLEVRARSIEFLVAQSVLIQNHPCRPGFVAGWAVKAVDIMLPSHKSISAQQAPISPVPQLSYGSSGFGFQFLMFASPLTHFKSRAH